jgi:hypothetical protein
MATKRKPGSPGTSCAMLVLEHSTIRASKHFAPPPFGNGKYGEVEPRIGKHFDQLRVLVNGIRDVGLVIDTIKTYPRMFVVRAELVCDAARVGQSTSFANCRKNPAAPVRCVSSRGHGLRSITIRSRYRRM